MGGYQNASEYLHAVYEKVVEEVQIHADIDGILGNFKRAGFRVKKYHVDRSDYRKYLDKADYETNYPEYVREFGDSLTRKKLEHYISYKLLNVKKDKVYLDVASSNSCFPQIVEQLSGAVAYRQDIKYPKGVSGKCIGSFASSIPLEDESVDYMGLHCSFEHFEGGEDFRFFNEAYRLLSDNGKVCIIPLYMADEYVITTSPDIWYSKYAAYKEAPQFDERAIININNKAKQRQSKYFSVPIIKEELLEKHSDKFYIKVIYMKNYMEIDGVRPFALLLQKKPRKCIFFAFCKRNGM